MLTSKYNKLFKIRMVTRYSLIRCVPIKVKYLKVYKVPLY